MPSLCRYFLCRSDITYQDALNALAQEAGIEDYNSLVVRQQIAGGDPLNSVMFHKSDPVFEAGWVSDLERITGRTIRTDHVGRRHDAILLVDYEQRVFVLSFNQAHHIVKRMPLVRNFGRVVASNAKEEDGFRGIKTKVYGGNPKMRHEQFGGRAHIDDADMPEGLYRLAGLSSKIAGDRPLLTDGNVGIRYWSPETAAEVHENLAFLLAAWNRGKYLDPEIERREKFLEIDDRVETTFYDSRLDEAILKGDPQAFTVSLNDSRLWTCVSHGYHLDQWLDVPISEPELLVLALRQAANAGRDIRKFHVKSDPGDGSPHISTPIRSLLSFEIEEPSSGDAVIWDEGSWFRAQSDWVQEQQEDALGLIQSTLSSFKNLTLPKWKGGERRVAGKCLRGEDAYLVDCGTHDFGTSSAVCHRSFPPSGMPRAEVCDLFLDSRFLLHVKGAIGFEAVNEAVGQAIQACKYSNSNRQYRAWAEGMLATGLADPVDLKDTRKYVFGVALIVPPKKNDPRTWSVRSLERIAALERGVSPYRAAVFTAEDGSGATQSYVPAKRKPA